MNFENDMQELWKQKVQNVENKVVKKQHLGEHWICRAAGGVSVMIGMIFYHLWIHKEHKLLDSHSNS